MKKSANITLNTKQSWQTAPTRPLIFVKKYLRVLSTAYKRPTSHRIGYRAYDYVYDEFYDCVICPENKVLHYSTTNREGYREYRSRPYICEQCPTRHQCTENAKFEKTVTRHIWQDWVELAEDARHTVQYKEPYRLQQEKIERVFADAKEKHGMWYTNYRGLTQVTNWVRRAAKAQSSYLQLLESNFDTLKRTNSILVQARMGFIYRLMLSKFPDSILFWQNVV